MFAGLSSGLGIASSLGQGFLGGKGASKAASTQAKWLQKGAGAQTEQYNNTANNLNPYITAGQNALGTYQDMLSNTTQPTLNYQQEQFSFDKWKDPSAQYANAEAGRALQATALAKGATGGGFAKALAQNQSNLANQAYSNAFSRWKDNSNMMYSQASDQYNRDYTAQQNQLTRYNDLASQGLNASNSLGQFGANYANNLSNIYGQIGDAKASGILGKYNAWSNALGGATQNLTSGLGGLSSLFSGGNPYSGRSSINK